MYLKAGVLKLYYMVFQRSMHEVEPLGVCSICWKIQTGHGCMCAMPFHMNETSEQTRQHYSKLKTWSRSLTTHVMQKKWEGGWPALKEVLHLSTYCIFLQEYCFLLKGIPCLQGSYFEDVESFKKKVMQKMRGRLNFIKGCIASFHTLQFSCKNIVPYLGEYFFFKADCNL